MMCNSGGEGRKQSSNGGDRKRAQGGDQPLGSCSLSHPGQLLRLTFKAQEQERNGVGVMGSTGDLVKIGGGNIVTGCQHTGTLLSSNSNIVICHQQHPGILSLFSNSDTSTACQASSRVPPTQPTQPHQPNIGMSSPITTTALPMPVGLIQAIGLMVEV